MEQSIAEKIIALEKEALTEWNKGNPSVYLALYSQEITYFDPFAEKRFDGFKKMKAFYETLRGTISVDKSEMNNVLVQGNDSMVVLTYNLNSYSDGKWNCTEVYCLEKDGKWRIIHNHWSFTKPNLGL
ncbi:YybH family protein [Bacteroides ihuae]|uniref:YybH family protein n=1 Tax=Bacteroides ihuae TaxID=1852362 RepID=UPI0008DB2CE6|nr:nuclear transport factor 2 family protein [Bacteroides ihuae]